MNSPSVSQIINLSHLSENEIVSIYPYGSRVYGTFTPQSDFDYIVIHNGKAENDAQQYDSYSKELSVHTYHINSWQHHINEHKIFAIECNSIVPIYSSETKNFNFELNHALLRKEISSKASNSWVKCKKKLTVETNEEYIGIKSLFHSFRIPIFGIQIAQYGKVVDFSAANHIWDELKNLDIHTITWNELKDEYQKRHNTLMSEFRKHAEKA